MNILFVCHGNVQRSQMAQGYYNHFTKTTDATSAGVDPKTPAKWSAPHPETIELMAKEGVDVSHHPVRLVTPQMVDQADIVYLITDVDVPDFLLQSPKVIQWDIEDPYEEPIEVVKRIQQEVKQHVLSILPN